MGCIRSKVFLDFYIFFIFTRPPSKDNQIVYIIYSAYLSCVDELVCETLGDTLDVPECGLAGSHAQQPHGLVDTTQR